MNFKGVYIYYTNLIDIRIPKNEDTDRKFLRNPNLNKIIIIRPYFDVSNM
jgi:hypothetical protein